jgi:hypothetical protein
MPITSVYSASLLSAWVDRRFWRGHLGSVRIHRGQWVGRQFIDIAGIAG